MAFAGHLLRPGAGLEPYFVRREEYLPLVPAQKCDALATQRSDNVLAATQPTKLVSRLVVLPKSERKSMI